MPEQDIQTFALHYDTWCADRLTGLKGVKPFEFFCADQFLKDRSLSDAEIISGQVDASDDGGVDSFYCFFNGVLLDDTSKVDPRSGGIFELKIIQSKEHSGFSPTAIDKLARFVDDLLNFSRPPDEYRYAYHDKLARLMEIFKAKFREVQRRSIPELSIEFFFISRLDVAPNRNSMKAAEVLVDAAATYYSETKVEPFRFINVADLWARFKVAKPTKMPLPVVKSFETKEGWVGLATLKDFYEFLKHPTLVDTDGYPKIDYDLFDSNVRGYQVNTKVNARITNTLTAAEDSAAAGITRKPPEFWQLNNGITILCPKATSADEVLMIDNPQIVNGLQTSRRIFEYYRTKETISDLDDRRILIRIIKTSDENARSEIIRATNDQNPMPAEAFLATQRIQYQIEEYLLDKGFFYDRRKGHYKAEKRQVSQIVNIIDLMQAVIAIMRRRPNDARGRPRDFLKERKRQQLFGADDNDEKDQSKPYQLDVYLRCVQIIRKIDSYLAALDLDSRTASNLRFYVALRATVEAIGNAHCPPNLIIALDVERDLTEELVKKSYRHIRALYNRHGRNDDAAKGKGMIDGLTKALKSRYSPSNKSRRKTTKGKGAK